MRQENEIELTVTNEVTTNVECVYSSNTTIFIGRI